MASIPYAERVLLLQDGKIDFLQFVMNGDNNVEFVNWCKELSVEPTPASAEFFLEMTEINTEEHSYIDNECDGIWN